MSKYVPTGRPRGRPRKSPPPFVPEIQPHVMLPGPNDDEVPTLSDGTVVATPEELTSLRPAICDPEHYPEDADAQWGVKETPKPVVSVAPPPVPVQRAVVTMPLRVDPPVPVIRLPNRSHMIGQFFDQLRKYTDTAEKIAWLRHNDKIVLRYLLRLGFEDVKWLLPKGLPPYTPFVMRRGGRIVPLKPGHTPTELRNEARRFYLFLDGTTTNMEREKREKLFQNMIEGMAPEEVEVLLAIKDKKLDKYAPKDVVASAFPGLFDQPFRLRFLR